MKGAAAKPDCERCGHPEIAHKVRSCYWDVGNDEFCICSGYKPKAEGA